MGELGREGARVVALDQRLLLGTVTAVCEMMAACKLGSAWMGVKLPGEMLKRLFLALDYLHTECNIIHTGGSSQPDSPSFFRLHALRHQS